MDDYNQNNYYSNSASFETAEAFETIEQIEESGAEVEKKTNVLALLSMIFGILGVVLFVICCGGWMWSLPFTVAALVMGIIANQKEKTGMGTAGFVLGIVGISLVVLSIVANIILGALQIGTSILFSGLPLLLEAMSEL